MTEQERKKRIKRRKKRKIRTLIARVEAVFLAILFLIFAGIVIREIHKNQQGEIKGGLLENEAGQNASEMTKNEAAASQKIEESAAWTEGKVDDGDRSEAAETTEMAENLQPEEQAAVLTFGGDVCFHDAYANMGAYVQRGSKIENCISLDLLQEMREADLCMVNNEFVYTTRGEPTQDKTYTLRSKPENVSILKDMGVDVVSLANNHSYDFGEISLLDTLQTLEEAEIPYVGAGRNLEEASKTVNFNINGIQIGIVSATQIERLDNPDTKGAGATTPGVFRCWGSDGAKLTQIIQTAKAENDFVIVYIHWGTENAETIDWAQEKQAVEIAQAGADLIVGDHPHCLQQFGNVEGVPVIYSLGNFWFNSKTIDTGLLKVKFSKEKLEYVQFLPAVQTNCTTTLSVGAEKERILSYMQSISPGVTIDTDGFVGF